MEVNEHALDNLCSPLGLVAVGSGYFLHAGRFYPLAARYRAGCTAYPVDNWQKDCRVMPLAPISQALRQ